jgi:hypothetical protein
MAETLQEESGPLNAGLAGMVHLQAELGVVIEQPNPERGDRRG